MTMDRRIMRISMCPSYSYSTRRGATGSTIHLPISRKKKAGSFATGL
jgi:hypothetical protein